MSQPCPTIQEAGDYFRTVHIRHVQDYVVTDVFCGTVRCVEVLLDNLEVWRFDRGHGGGYWHQVG